MTAESEADEDERAALPLASGPARRLAGPFRPLAWGLGLMLGLQALTAALLFATNGPIVVQRSLMARSALARVQAALEHQQATLAMALLTGNPLLTNDIARDAQAVAQAFAALGQALPQGLTGRQVRHQVALAQAHWQNWQATTARPFATRLTLADGAERERLRVGFDAAPERQTLLGIGDELATADAELAALLGFEHAEDEARLHPLQVIGGLTLLASLLIAALLLRLARQRVITPLATLTRHIEQISRGAEEAVSPPYLTRADTMGLLARNLDELTQCLLRERRQGADLELARATLDVQRRQLSMTNAALNEKTQRLERHGRAQRASDEAQRQQTAELEQANRHLQSQTEALETARVALEERAHELERAGRFKSEFLANMSHELRTPLNGIVALARMLADDPEGHLAGEEIESAQAIEASGRHLLKMINSLLDLSRLEAGRLDANADELALAGWLEALAREQRILAQQKGLGFTLALSPHLPGLFSTDGTRLRQILQNLLDNALKFTHAGELSLSAVPSMAAPGAGGLKHPGGVLFEVADSGKGLPEGRIEQLFDAFDQGDVDTHRHYGGTGLGLAISRRLARLLGGDLVARNREAGGAVFSLWLPPLASGPADVLTHAPARLAAGLVVVGPDAELARRLSRLADRRGLRTYHVTSDALLPRLRPGQALIVRQTLTGLTLDISVLGVPPRELPADIDDETLEQLLFAADGEPTGGLAKSPAVAAGLPPLST